MEKNNDSRKQISFRSPTSYDATAMQLLAIGSEVLSVHDTYYYALMARHFQATCLIAESEDMACGYVTGYTPPAQPDTLFVWQIGVAQTHQGQGIGKNMLLVLLDAIRPAFLEATIDPENDASIAVFRSVANSLNARHSFSENPFFSVEDLGPGEPVEHLMQIGPFSFSRHN